MALPAHVKYVVIGAGILAAVLLLIGLAIWWPTPLTPRTTTPTSTCATPVACTWR